MQEWYKAALNETLREQEHEQEAMDAGEITQDLRNI
jgi:hypothetical protein